MKTFTRDEVQELLKKQRKRIQNSVGRMRYDENETAIDTTIAIIKRIGKCSLVSIPKEEE